MKAFSSPSLGTKGSDTRAVLSHVMVALRLRRLLFPLASAVPLIATSRIEPCLQVSLIKGAKHAVERKRSGPARPGLPVGCRGWRSRVPRAPPCCSAHRDTEPQRVGNTGKRLRLPAF